VDRFNTNMEHDYTKMRITELKDELRHRRLQVTGTKFVLINRLRLDDARKTDPYIEVINIRIVEHHIYHTEFCNPHIMTFRDIKQILSDKLNFNTDAQKIFITDHGYSTIFIEPHDDQLLNHYGGIYNMHVFTETHGIIFSYDIQISICDPIGKILFSDNINIFGPTINDIKNMIKSANNINYDFDICLPGNGLVNQPVILSADRNLAQNGLLCTHRLVIIIVQ